MIRKMIFDDIPQVQKIDKECFSLKYERKAEGIKAYIEKSNNASIVYEVNKKIVGYNFIHLWGNFAWFGTFGVNPECQGKGIGKEMLNHTIKFLKEDMKICNIGLNTMPESPYNVGVYMSMGFKPLKLCLLLKKQLLDSTPSLCSNKYKVVPADLSSEFEYTELIHIIKVMCNKISPSLDLSSQLHLIKYENFGIVFILKDNKQIKGFAICHTEHMTNTTSDCLEIKLLCLTNDVNYTEALDSILYKCISYAKSINYKNICIDCTTYNYDLCMYLLSTHKFKIEKTQLIMIMGNEHYINKFNGLILCRWAG